MSAGRLPAQLQNVEADITVGQADEAAVVDGLTRVAPSSSTRRPRWGA
jgi:hypothetical protein